MATERPTYCLIDLDGVLVDFHNAAIRLHDLPVDPDTVGWDLFSGHMTAEDFWKPLGYDFWAGLDWIADGRQILRAAERHFSPDNIFILSSPCWTKGCAEGKIDWVQRKLPQYRKRLILGNRKDICAGQDRLLIDDSDTQCEMFHRAGGSIVMVPRSWNVDAHLKGQAADVVAERLDQHCSLKAAT